MTTSWAIRIHWSVVLQITYSRHRSLELRHRCLLWARCRHL